jgi:RNA polymerase sigma-70 factor (ECF subfamily)
MRCAYRDLEARLRPFVARRVSDASAVDDVMQDVFLRMQRSLADLREEEQFGPWAYRVARSAIAEHRRARARHPLTTSEPPERAVDPSEQEDDRAVERELAAYIAPFIAMLSTPYREALTLTELEGLAQKDAAEMVGVSLSAMKSRVQRGRERLRKLLEDCCEIALDARGRVIECKPRTDDCCCEGNRFHSLSTKQLAEVGQALANSGHEASDRDTVARSAAAKTDARKIIVGCGGEEVDLAKAHRPRGEEAVCNEGATDSFALDSASNGQRAQ